MALFFQPPIGLGDRKLKIQKNGTDIASFSANEQNVYGNDPVIANITVPTTASNLDYDNTTSGLTADDVQEAIDEIVSDIPTVNNGTLTIQKNGTNVQTFTANQSTDVTANISVPTKTSDLTNDSGFVTTDENVKQSASTGNVDRRILLSTSATNDAETGQVYKNSGFVFNPSKSALTITRETTTADDALSSVNLTVKDTDLNTTDTSTISARSPHSSSGAGANLVVNAKGALFAGGGESANNLYLALKGSSTSYNSENAFFTADSSLFLLSNCNTIANRLGIGIDTNGAIKPVLAGEYSDNAGKIGISGNRFAEGNFVALNGTTLNGSTIGSSPKFTDTPSSYFGTCASDADVAAKTVVLENATGFELVEGTIIGVKFTNTNTASNVTLNVNNTGDKSIWYGTSAYTGSTATVVGAAGGTNYYMYDGTYWVWLNAYKLDGNTNTIPSAYCDTAKDTAAKTASCSGYYLLANSYIHVIITTTNTAASALTLNINGKGAKPIYINGTASSASNYSLTRGSYIVYYNGTNYYFRTDGKLTGAGLVDIAGNTTKYFKGDGTLDTPVDENVKQSADNATNSNFEVLFSGTADNTTRTEGTKKSTKITFNPSTGNLQTTKLNGVTVGSSPVFTDINVNQINTDAIVGQSPLLFSYEAAATNYLGPVYKTQKISIDPKNGQFYLYRDSTTSTDGDCGITFGINNTDVGGQKYSKIYTKHQNESGTLGLNLLIEARGRLYAGSGDAPASLYTAHKAAGSVKDEKAYYLSDNNLYIESNCDTIADRKGIVLNTSNEILPVVADVPTNNSGKIGNATYKFAEGNFVDLNTSTLNNLTVPNDSGTIAVDEDIKGILKTYENLNYVGKNFAIPNVANIPSSITVVDNGDGTFKVTNDGTNSSATAVRLANVSLKAGVTYNILGCPGGGGDTRWRLDLRIDSSTVLGTDKGTGFTYTPETDQECYLTARFYGGYQSPELLYKPMVTTDMSYIYPDFEPHLISNKELEEKINGLYTESTDNEPYTLRRGKGDMVDMELVGGSFAWNQLVTNSSYIPSQTTHGLTFTNNGDGSISISGTVDEAYTYNYITISSGINFVRGTHVYFIAPSKKIPHRIGIGGFSPYVNANAEGGFAKLSGSGAWYNGLFLEAKLNDTFNISDVKFNIIDLTVMFGTTIADAIYAMEQATSGSGVAFFRKYFPKNYYAYDSGSIQSVCVSGRKVVGKNLLGGCTRQYNDTYTVYGGILTSNNPDGSLELPPGNYTMSASKSISTYSVFIDGTIKIAEGSGTSLSFVLTERHSVKLAFGNSGGTNNLDLQLEYGTTATTYEPYESTVYPIPNEQLRGMFTLENGKLKANGDILDSSGKLTRNFGIVDLGSLTWEKHSESPYWFRATIPYAMKSGWTEVIDGICEIYQPSSGSSVYTGSSDKAFGGSASVVYIYDSAKTSLDATSFKTAMSGVDMVYAIATPITESAEPYQNPQRADASGTEEFIDFGVSAGTRDVAIPCGHNSIYTSSEVIQPLEDYVDGYRINDIRNDVEYYKETGYLTKNLIDQYGKGDGYVYGYYLNANGQETISYATDIMEYVEVEPSTTYTVQGISGNSNNGYVEYDASKTMVAHSIVPSSNPLTFTTSANTKYLRFNRDRNADNQVQLEKGAMATEYMPYIPSNIELNATKPNTWTGTQAEYALQASNIPDGYIVNITDDEGTYADETKVIDNNLTIVPAYTSFISTNAVHKVGNIVYVFLRGSIESSGGTIVFASTPYKPKDEFAFINIISQSAPYNSLGNIFIRRSSNEVCLPGGVTSPCTFWAYGSYICQ